MIQLEDQLRGVNAFLHEQQQETLEAQSLREKAHRMFAELEESKRSRKVLEARARELERLLEKERADRDSWLASFMTELQRELGDLETSVDKGIGESSRAMQGRLDQADEVMGKLLHRVDSIFTSGGSTSSDATPAATVPLPAAPAAVPAPLAVGAPLAATVPLAASSVPSSQPMTPQAMTPQTLAQQQQAMALSAPQQEVSGRASGRATPKSEDLVASHTPSTVDALSVTAPPQTPSSGSISTASLRPAPRTPASAAEAAPAAAASGQDPLTRTMQAIGSGDVEAADILQSWTELLSENLLLQQKQSELLSRKKKYATRSLSTSTSPTPPRLAASQLLARTGVKSSHSQPPTCSPSPWVASPRGTRPRLPIVQEQ